jgi:hypothetical protein
VWSFSTTLISESAVYLVGIEHVDALLTGRVYDAKIVFNARGAIVFPSECQHREIKAEGISYEDDYRGNALAAMLRRDAIEIRFHRDFSDAAVSRIVGQLLSVPALAALATARLTYQGRVLKIENTAL